MSLQYIVDIANSISIDRKKVVGIQYTRSEVARTELTPTKNPWRFIVEVPNMPYYIMRPILEQLNVIDRYQPELLSFNNNVNTKHIFRQQSNVTFATPLQVVSYVGNQLTITNLPAVAVGTTILNAGDLLQINGFPYPFTVIGDVLMPAAANVTVTTHRPNIITNSVVGLNITVGSSCQFNLFCPNMPSFKLTPGRKVLAPNGSDFINASLVEFDGAFEMFEWTQNS